MASQIDPKDSANLCLELLKANMNHFEKTRQIQWNFNSIFWTGILVSASFLYKEGITLNDPNFNYFINVILLSYLSAIILIQVSLATDKGKNERIQVEMEKLMSLSITTGKSENKSEKIHVVIRWVITHWRSVLWISVQTGITYFLLKAFSLLATISKS